MSYEKCLKMMLKHEGMDVATGKTGFVMDPDDNDGGATNYGITRKTFQDYMGRDVSIDEMRWMPWESVKAIYRKGYWDRYRCDDMPTEGLGLMVFDFAVNSGNRSAKILQEIVNTKVDGHIGEKTMKLVKAHDPDFLKEQFHKKRQEFYDYLAKNGKEKYIRGWTNRNNAVYQEANDLDQ